MEPRSPKVKPVSLTRRVMLRVAATTASSMGLAACGFKLRGPLAFAFSSIAIVPNPGGAVAQELRRLFGPNVRVLSADEPIAQAQLVLDVANEQREKIVVALNSSGQVREFQLRLRVSLRLRTAKGKDLMDGVQIMQQRGFSYNESYALAKEAESTLLYRDMQTDVVQQILRRLAAIHPEQLD